MPRQINMTNDCYCVRYKKFGATDTESLNGLLLRTKCYIVHCVLNGSLSLCEQLWTATAVEIRPTMTAKVGFNAGQGKLTVSEQFSWVTGVAVTKAGLLQ